MSSKITKPSPFAKTLQLLGLPLLAGVTIAAVVPIWKWNWVAGLVAILPVMLVAARLVGLVLGFFMKFTPEGQIRDSLKKALAAGDLEEVKRLRDRMVDEFGMVTGTLPDAAGASEADGEGGEAVEISSYMRESAEMHVQMAQQHFDMELDYSEASLKKIDEAITEFHPDGVMSESTYVPYTAYVGEVVRRNIGGEWEDTEDRGPAIVSADPEFTVFPYAWVVKRFENGDEDSVAFKLVALKQVVELDQALSDTPPPPEDVAAASGSDSEASNTASEAGDLMAKAPILVFSLVNSTVEEVSDAQHQVLADEADKAQNHENGLYRASMGMVGEGTKLISEDEVESPIATMAALTELREQIGNLFPDEVDGYCAALYEYAKKIAAAGPGGDAVEASLRLTGAALGQEVEKA